MGERLVRVSSPDKPYFPERGLTKLDVVRYFLAVGDGILRALRDRPTMLERWPRGSATSATGPAGRIARLAPASYAEAGGPTTWAVADWKVR